MITKNVKLNALIAQLSKFGSVSVLTTIFGISSNYILLEVLHLPLYPVYISVYFVGIFISYVLNARFTFKEKANVRDGAKYYASYIIGLLVGLILLYIFDQTFEYSDFMLTILVIPFRFIVTFFLIKKVVYGRE